ncbi:hypothetical protein SAMN05443428_14113 [Caloramator quimbayensis]|uniref:Uncharacterized protein n=1 Tax=Caloramator quimbayensis TaxID=1147123 RepID=A0A1T4YEI1_9CLOT|nr:hypothetical protein [Caloramator quimbayensis]SKB00100.1 hypothetical protein SAMN05443428_14113 [Caloramator quimbayensis]
MSEVDILYQISNLKEVDYKNLLMISGLIELLISKNIISREELLNKIKSLDNITSHGIIQ